MRIQHLRKTWFLSNHRAPETPSSLVLELIDLLLSQKTFLVWDTTPYDLHLH